jgi:hypothetical protein
MHPPRPIQLRTSAVSLVKEAILEGLASPSNASNESVFASPLLIQTLGPILFQPNPPDFFASEIPEEAIHTEMPRLVECLAFYYVLLLRDVENHVRFHIILPLTES